MIFILIAGALAPLAIMLGDKVVRIENMIITIPGMLQDGIRIPKELLNGFILIAIVFYGLSYCKLKPFKNPIIPLCIAWSFFVSIISKYEFSFYFLFYTLLGFSAIVVLASLVRDNKYDSKVRIFLKCIAYVGLLQCFYATCQALVLDQFFVVKSTNFAYSIGDGQFSLRMVGFIGNPSLLAIYLAMILPIYLYLKERWAYLAFTLALITIFACDSTTGIVSSSVGMLFYLFFVNKKLFFRLSIVLIVGLSLTASIYYPKHKQKVHNFLDGTGRIEVWKNAYLEWIDKNNRYTLGPITGHGLRSWQYEIGLKEPDPQKQWHEAHSDPFQILYETGIIGFSLYIVLVFVLFKTFLSDITSYKIAMMSGLVSFGISGLTLFPLYSSCIVLYAVIFTGLIFNKKGESVCIKKLFV